MTGSTNRDAELFSLRARFQESQETLDAIRAGAVDAILVPGDNGDKVYTLEGADTPYRILVEKAREGALTLDRDGTIFYANQYFATMIGRPLDQVIGNSIAAFVAREDRGMLRQALTTAADRDVRREISFLGGDNKRCPSLMAVGALPTNDMELLAAIVTDITDLKRAQEAEATERLTSSMLEQLVDAVIVCDAAGRIIQANRAAQKILMSPYVGRPTGEGLAIEPEVSGREVANGIPAGIDFFVTTALAGFVVHGVEVRARKVDGAIAQFLLNIGPLVNSQDKCIGCLISLTDITSRKQSETRLRTLVDELDHRVKNTLARVHAIALRTWRFPGSAEERQTAFIARLMNMGTVQELLSRGTWQGVSLEELVAAIVRPADDGRCASLSGPAVKLDPNETTTLGMMFHELTTNAVKFGAWSQPGGTVAVSWRIAETAESTEVLLTWAERDGPPVVPPQQKGCGFDFIVRGVEYSLGGKVELTFDPAGLRCTASFPLQTKSEMRSPPDLQARQDA